MRFSGVVLRKGYNSSQKFHYSQSDKYTILDGALRSVLPAAATGGPGLRVLALALPPDTHSRMQTNRKPSCLISYAHSGPVGTLRLIVGRHGSINSGAITRHPASPPARTNPQSCRALRSNSA